MFPLLSHPWCRYYTHISRASTNSLLPLLHLCYHACSCCHSHIFYNSNISNYGPLSPLVSRLFPLLLFYISTSPYSSARSLLSLPRTVTHCSYRHVYHACTCCHVSSNIFNACPCYHDCSSYCCSISAAPIYLLKRL